MELLPAELREKLEQDFHEPKWVESRRTHSTFLSRSEASLIREYQDQAQAGGVFLLMAVAMVLGRKPDDAFIDRWYKNKEKEVRARQQQGTDPREAVRLKLGQLHALLQHFDRDSLGPRLRVVREELRRKSLKREAEGDDGGGGERAEAEPDLWELRSAQAIMEEMRTLAEKKAVLLRDAEHYVDPASATASDSQAEGGEGGAEAGRRRYVHPDVSQGTWGDPPGSVPVPCVNDIDDREPPTLQFLKEEEYGEGVPLPSPEFLTGCTCQRDRGGCSKESGCRCIREHRDFCSYRADGRLAEQMWKTNAGRYIYECNDACSCVVSGCRNRVVQKGPFVPVEVFMTKDKGWGVRALRLIPKGTFICKYAGEIITLAEFERRDREYRKLGDFTYLYDLDFGLEEGQQQYMIDATIKGNVARYFNHSCEPNMVNFQVFINDIDIHKPRVAFFASRDVQPGEELTFDYNIQSKDKTKECNCGAPTCRGKLL